jgi:hypothetical protein
MSGHQFNTFECKGNIGQELSSPLVSGLLDREMRHMPYPVSQQLHAQMVQYQ